jgi:hypothetical protein
VSWGKVWSGLGAEAESEKRDVGEEDLGMNWIVEAGAIILGVVMLRPRIGEKGAAVIRCSL